MIRNETIVRGVEGSTPQDSANYYIDPKNISQVTQILRNMYSDPAMAVVREYVANAIDAHEQAGCPEKPIEIWAPTEFEPAFKVRDFGPGLSVEDTKRLLYGFGASGACKTASNNQIGGFGIGCKCGFAKAEQFQYIIYHGGRQRVWSCYLDEHDNGKARLLSDEPSSEPSGIMVSIPVTPIDMPGYVSRIITAIAFYKTLPVVHGIDVNHEDWKQLLETRQPDYIWVEKTAVIQRKDQRVPVCLRQYDSIGLRTLKSSLVWAPSHKFHPDYRYASSPSGGTSKVVMGGVAYDLDWTQVWSQEVGDKLNANGVRREFSYWMNMWTVFMPIGALQLAPSREALQYSTHTKQILSALMNHMISTGFINDVRETWEAYARSSSTWRRAQILNVLEALIQPLPGRVPVIEDILSIPRAPTGECVHINANVSIDRIVLKSSYGERRAPYMDAHQKRIDVGRVANPPMAVYWYRVSDTPDNQPVDGVDLLDNMTHRIFETLYLLRPFGDVNGGTYTRQTYPVVVIRATERDWEHIKRTTEWLNDGTCAVLEPEDLVPTWSPELFRKPEPVSMYVRTPRTRPSSPRPPQCSTKLVVFDSAHEPDRSAAESAAWKALPMKEAKQSTIPMVYIAHKKFQTRWPRGVYQLDGICPTPPGKLMLYRWLKTGSPAACLMPDRLIGVRQGEDETAIEKLPNFIPLHSYIRQQVADLITKRPEFGKALPLLMAEASLRHPPINLRELNTLWVSLQEWSKRPELASSKLKGVIDNQWLKTFNQCSTKERKVAEALAYLAIDLYQTEVSTPIFLPKIAGTDDLTIMSPDNPFWKMLFAIYNEYPWLSEFWSLDHDRDRKEWDAVRRKTAEQYVKGNEKRWLAYLA